MKSGLRKVGFEWPMNEHLFRGSLVTPNSTQIGWQVCICGVAELKCHRHSYTNCWSSINQQENVNLATIFASPLLKSESSWWWFIFIMRLIGDLCNVYIFSGISYLGDGSSIWPGEGHRSEIREPRMQSGSARPANIRRTKCRRFLWQELFICTSWCKIIILWDMHCYCFPHVNGQLSIAKCTLK